MASLPLRTRRVRILDVHVPVSAATLASLAAGDATALDREPALSAMLAIVRDGGPLGDFGAYRGVVELRLGWEIFTPADDARPTLGAAGAESRSPTVILHIHIPAEGDSELADAAIARVLEAHPWEIPVIEISTAELLVR